MINFDPENVPNEDLYRMCLAGEESAWEYVYGFVLAVTRWPRWNLADKSEDLAQTIVLFLMERGLKQVRQPAAFREFVKKVAVSKILDSYKKWRPRGPSLNQPMGPDDDDLRLDLPSDDPGPERQTELHDFMAQVEAALHKLSDLCREVLEKFFAYKMGFLGSYAEIVALLGRPMGTVSSQIRRCLKQFSRDEQVRQYLEG